jgi:YbbR domain-containing protein
VRRVTGFLLRNWPLRLGAILLATVLYTGIVVGQNVRTWTGEVPIERIRQAANVTLLADIPPVTSIRYRAPLDVLLSPNSFAATVDLSRVTAQSGGPPVAVPVTLLALDQRVQIVDFQPREVQIQLDPVAERMVPVTVGLGAVPDGINVGPPQTDPSSVTLRGASSRVNSVSQIVARVTIDAAALNVDGDYDLVAVDGNGNEVPNVEIEPARVRVRVAVARELANRSLPVVPVLTGVPAVGYRISAVTVEPLVVTLSGEAAILASLESAPTEAINVQGRSTDLEANVNLNLPAGISVNGSDQVKVRLTIVPDMGTRSFQVAVSWYSPSDSPQPVLTPSVVTVVLSGPIALLNSTDVSNIIATAGSGDMPAIVPVNVRAPAGLNVVSVTPSDVQVSSPAPTATP